MNIIISLIFILLIFPVNNFPSFKHSQKTYLSPRTYRPISYTPWHIKKSKSTLTKNDCNKIKSINKDYDKILKKRTHLISGDLQVTGFFQNSTGSADIGRYFGIGNGKNTFVIGDGKEIEGDIFIRRYDKEAAGTITLNPKHMVYGVNFEYIYEANKFFIKAALPITNVKNDVGMKITNAVDAVIDSTAKNQKKYSLADLFKGKLKIDDPEALQDPLTHAKIDGSKSTGGASDLDLKFGYKINQTEKQYTIASLDFVIPTGNKATGEYLWEPIYGNGKHIGVGGTFDCGFNVYDGNFGLIWITGGASYKYLFSNTQKRTLNMTIFKRKFAQYITVGKLNQENKPLFPLANISTNEVKVSPGGQINQFVNMSLQKNNIIFDLGYNSYWKDGESVLSKETDQTQYAVPFGDYTTSKLLNGDNSHKLDSIKSKFTNIEQHLLDERSAATPMQLSHRIFVDLSCKKEINDRVDIFFGTGGAYEFAQGNSAINQYLLWIKTSVSF